VDLQESSRFESLGVELLSISPDHSDSWLQIQMEYGVETPLLSDARNGIASRYGVMRWRIPPTAPIETAEPGHTFVLVDERGRVAWVRDYGAQENGGLMYVPPEDLLPPIQRALADA
jgi:peroxiredoxin